MADDSEHGFPAFYKVRAVLTDEGRPNPYSELEPGGGADGRTRRALQAVKARRLQFLDEVFKWVAGDDHNSYELLEKDFVKRKLKKLQGEIDAKNELLEGDEAEVNARNRAIVDNLVASFNKIPVQNEKNSTPADHTRRSCYLQMLAPIEGMDRAELQRMGFQGVGVDAWNAARSACSAPDFDFSAPEPPRSGTYSLEERDPEFAGRVAKFWCKEEFTRPDVMGEPGDLVLTVPPYIVAEAIMKENEANGGLCGKTKAYEYIPNGWCFNNCAVCDCPSLRLWRMKTDICAICDDCRKIAGRLSAYKQRLDDAHGAGGYDQWAPIDKAQVARMEKVLSLGEEHKQWAARQRENLDIAVARSMAANSNQLLLLLDFKSSDMINKGVEKDDVGERGTEWWEEQPCGVLGICIWTPGCQEMEFYSILYPESDHTAFAAILGIETLLHRLSLDRVTEICAFSDCGRHFRAHAFVAHLCGIIPQRWGRWVKGGGKDGGDGDGGGGWSWQGLRTSCNFLIEQHGKNDCDRKGQQHNSYKKTLFQKPGRIKDTVQYAAGLNAEALLRHGGKTFHALPVEDFDLQCGRFKIVEHFHLMGSHCYRSGNWKTTGELVATGQAVRRGVGKGVGKGRRKKVPAREELSGDVELLSSTWSDISETQVIATTMALTERPAKANPTDKPRQAAAFENLHHKMLLLQHGEAVVSGDKEAEKDATKDLADLGKLDATLAALVLPKPPRTQNKSFMRKRIADVGRFCEIHSTDQGFRTGLIISTSGVEPNRSVTLRVFGVASTLQYHYEEEVLLEMIFDGSMYVYPRDGEPNYKGAVKPLVESGDAFIDDGRPLFAYCEDCGRARVIPKTLPYYYTVKNKNFFFCCRIKTGAEGCNAVFEKDEVEFNMKENLL